MTARTKKNLIRVEYDMYRFNRTLTKYIKRFPERAWTFLRKVAFDVIRGTARLTPVDTGRCRAAWVAFLETGGVTVPVTGKNVSPDAVEMGKQEASWRFNKRAVSIRVTNGVDYSVYLEFGHSQQAPQGMLRRTINEYRTKLVNKMKKVV